MKLTTTRKATSKIARFRKRLAQLLPAFTGKGSTDAKLLLLVIMSVRQEDEVRRK